MIHTCEITGISSRSRQQAGSATFGHQVSASSAGCLRDAHNLIKVCLGRCSECSV
jgi:hypothetical protein